MIVLVTNIGSTSFKHKLFDMPAERLIATGDADRIGQGGSAWSITVGDQSGEGRLDFADHAAAIEFQLEQLVKLGAITKMDEIEAIGFKAVHGGDIKEPVRIDDTVLQAMEQFTDIAPSHNPPYIAAMRAFGDRLPEVPQVAAFETVYHQTIPLFRQIFAIPYDWTQMGVRRYGFHGASHRYIATRMGQIAPDAKKLISCHLGGSCSISAIQDGRSLANSFGMTVQSGVFHNNRVGDFDTWALLRLLKIEPDLNRIFGRMSREGGLLGISGISPDLREIEEAAAAGNDRAKLAVDAFVDVCRQYVGAYLTVLDGTDAIVFTGGIGQNGKHVRAAICDQMGFAGLKIDPDRNDEAMGGRETRIDAAPSEIQLWVIPTNEELIVARQTFEVLSGEMTHAG